MTKNIKMIQDNRKQIFIPSMTIILLLLFVGFNFNVNPAYAQSNWVAIGNQHKSLFIDTNLQKRYEFKVEMAVTQQQQQRGLMGRMSIGPDEGMIFLYPDDRIVKMWMANTYIPLDMLFIDSTGTVIAIEKNATPMSRTPIGPDVPVRAVAAICASYPAVLWHRQGTENLHI